MITELQSSRVLRLKWIAKGKPVDNTITTMVFLAKVCR